MFVHQLWSLHCPSSLLDLDCDLAKKMCCLCFLLEHLWSHDWTTSYTSEQCSDQSLGKVTAPLSFQSRKNMPCCSGPCSDPRNGGRRDPH